MPNQQNFPDTLDGSNYQRPSRVSSTDINLIRTTQHQIIFGTNVNDTVEVWIYNTDGSFAGHTTLAVNDPSLTLTTLIDNTGTYEYLNVDMQTVCNSIDVGPGRYALSLNFFRNEVGSESGYQLYISQISDDRTELQLTPVSLTGSVEHDIYEWVVPSAPKEFAVGLVDQLFGQAISGSTSQQITSTNIGTALDNITDGTMARINYANSLTPYTTMVNSILVAAYPLVLNLMAADMFNLNIQTVELEGYIDQTVTSLIHTLTQQGNIDTRFSII